MKAFSSFLITFIFVLFAMVSGCTERNPAQDVGEKEKQIVAAIMPLSHPSLEQSLKGFIQGLKESGFDESKIRMEILNANGDFARIPSLVERALAMKSSVVFVVTTPAAAEAVKITDPAGVPLVYTAVTDPVAAGIVTSMDGSETLATGVTDRYPVKEQVRIFRLLQPSMKTAALLFNPSEQNSRILVTRTIDALSNLGVETRKYEVHNPGEIPNQATQALSMNDCLIVNGDNLVTEYLSTVINLCIAQKKPLFVGDPDSVRKGAIAAVGPGYFDIGRRTGNKAAEILSGKSPKDIPSEYPGAFDYIVNTKAAESMGLEISDSFWNSREIWESRSASYK